MTPVVAAVFALNDFHSFIDSFFMDEDIPLWLIIMGSMGQVIFTLRFVYQWYYSKKFGASVLPVNFWIISLVGSLTIALYGIIRLDPILILGQSTGFIVYIRNIMIGNRETKKDKKSMKVLVTGVVGFIGSFLAERLVKRGDEVVGLDNLNAYYPVSLKLDRLKRLGIKEVKASAFVTSTIYANLRFIQMDLADREGIAHLFADEQFNAVCNLAAQAGVRYSIENPEAYIQSNIVGFLHILEGCRQNQVKHLVYASSSSVYGLNKQIPFKETDQVDQPVSLYGATKKADELMAFSYSQLYGLPATGLRYFYGLWALGQTGHGSESVFERNFRRRNNSSVQSW